MGTVGASALPLGIGIEIKIAAGFGGETIRRSFDDDGHGHAVGRRFRFNAGGALAADGSAAMAMTVTHVAAATASLTWMFIEWVQHGKPSLVGMVTGTIAGLATITPASGFVGPIGALVIGIAAGPICYQATGLIKQTLKIDDSLDVFAVHGVGGCLGVLPTAVLAAPALGGLGLVEGFTIGKHLWVQVVGVVAESVVKTIQETANTGKIGDGKIFVHDLGHVVRMRSGETDADAF